MPNPASTNERIRRKLRPKKVSPDDPAGDSTGKVVSKKSANNDPERKHRVAKEFVEFYKTGSSDNPKQFVQLLEHLISMSIENGGKLELPYNLSRLQELNTLLKEDVEEDGEDSRTYTLTGKSSQLDNFEKFMWAVQNLCDVGSSRTLELHVDGDGPAKIVISKEEGEINKPDDDQYDTDKDVMSFGIV